MRRTRRLSRRSIRLKGYDYSSAGQYFVTINVQNRECLFGEVRDGELNMNDAGRLIDKWWNKIAEKFPDVQLDVYIVMPDHFHGIIAITDPVKTKKT